MPAVPSELSHPARRAVGEELAFVAKQVEPPAASIHLGYGAAFDAYEDMRRWPRIPHAFEVTGHSYGRQDVPLEQVELTLLAILNRHLLRCRPSGLRNNKPW